MTTKQKVQELIAQYEQHWPGRILDEVLSRSGLRRAELPREPERENKALKAFLSEPEPMVFTDGVFRQIEYTVGSQPAEQGGVLGGSSDGFVSRFNFDRSAARSGVTYSPDTATLNALMKGRWNPRGIRLRGFVHSHPVGFNGPSEGDRRYASRILSAIPDLDELLLPIVQSRGDSVPYSINGYRAKRAGRQVVIDSADIVALPRYAMSPYADPMFNRVAEVYDLLAMQSTRLIVVGVGGAASFVEEMARAGVGEFVLIDPDTVDVPNLATQQVYRSDLGRFKVQAVADRIRDINPNCRVWAIEEHSDALSDEEFGRLLHGYLPGSGLARPGNALLCGFTDSFSAQARVSRLALEFAVPMLAAQVYAQGGGAEISFSAPGVTPACGRCVLGGRYRAHLDHGFENEVGSRGTPLFATTRLNATKAMVALALIHGSHPDAAPYHKGTRRWAELLERIARKTLIQIRIDPDIGTVLGLSIFDKVFNGADQDRIVADETVWLPQQPEGPESGFNPCPDCGGTGNLLSVEGKIGPTAAIPSVWGG